MNTIKVTERNDLIIKKFIDDFSINQNPIEVRFRELLPEIKNIDRYTHLIHSYPAKLLVHIPYFFLNNTTLSKKGDYVLDPFSGSGTVLLEGILSGRNTLGADSNPLARLIAEVKVTKLETDTLPVITKNIIKQAKKISNPTIPEVVNCHYWFSERTVLQLSRLLIAIKNIDNEPVRKFMMVSFSNCVRKVSYADQRVSVPVKLNPLRYITGSKENTKIVERISQLESIDVYKKFEWIVNENILRYREFERTKTNNCNARIISLDAKILTRRIDSKTLLKSNSIQLIITSPPYAGAQKYIRASSLNLGWTELASIEELVLLDRKSIGRENFRKSEIKIAETGIQTADELINGINTLNPTRASIVCNYLLEMKIALDEMIRVLKKDGFLVLIVGNNMVCGREFNTQEYFSSYLRSKGMKMKFKLIDDIQSYGLMTKRNKTADIISREWILVFQK